MNRLKREGGSLAPSPGHRPRGANQKAMNPASMSMPSDWYDEKSCRVAMHERKSRVASAIVSRGQTFATTSTEHAIPATTTIVSARSPAPSQNRLGAYQ